MENHMRARNRRRPSGDLALALARRRETDDVPSLVERLLLHRHGHEILCAANLQAWREADVTYIARRTDNVLLYSDESIFSPRDTGAVERIRALVATYAIPYRPL
jgi:hypothetical protein